MGVALALAERTRGRTAPNPNVGCVIVKDGRVVGRGWTQPGGRPHAEAMALAAGFDAAVDATDAYDGADPAELAVAPDDFHPNAEGHARIARRLEAAVSGRVGRAARPAQGDGPR